MASAAPLLDLSSNGLDLAAQRAEGLVAAGSQALQSVADEIELEALVADAKTHRLRSVIIGLVVIALIALVVKKVAGGSDDDPTKP